MTWLNCWLLTDLPGVGPHPVEGQIGRLLHHVAQLAGQGELALAVHLGGLDEHDLPAHLGPGQAHRNARLTQSLLHLTLVHGGLQEHVQNMLQNTWVDCKNFKNNSLCKVKLNKKCWIMKTIMSEHICES